MEFMIFDTRQLGKIQVPGHLIEEIEGRLHQAYDDFYCKYGMRPSYLSLNRIAYGAIKGTLHYKGLNINPLSSLKMFMDAEIICNPMQGELIKALGEPDFAFLYQD
jgi:hypothetical protein